jgi:hypothetical protein
VSDLIAFIQARLDEDEQVARRVEAAWRCIAGTGEIVASDGTHAEVCAEAHWEGVGEHIARHDPARVLREVEAKRKLLAYLVSLEDKATDNNWWNLDTCEPFQLLAATWSDHPGYRAEWAP